MGIWKGKELKYKVVLFRTTLWTFEVEGGSQTEAISKALEGQKRKTFVEEWIEDLQDSPFVYVTVRVNEQE